MIETYKQFRRSAEKNYLEKPNEKLVEIYRNAKNEYERSQSISALFVNNFGMLLSITNKYYMESSEKAGMVTMELVKVLNDFNGETKFITYLTHRIDNLFLWNYTKNKKRLKFNSRISSLDELISNDDGDDFDFQISDNNQEYLEKKFIFLQDIKNAFRSEYRKIKSKINKATSVIEKDLFELEELVNIEEIRVKKETMKLHEKELSVLNKELETLRFGGVVLRVMYKNEDLTASQIARKLGLFTTKGENGYLVEKPNAPDIILHKNIVKGKLIITEEIVTLVREAKWNKIQKTISGTLRRIFDEYNICFEN